jgi:Leucine-rich repeat (LRR) protein
MGFLNKIILIFSISIFFLGCKRSKDVNEIIPETNKKLETDIIDYNHYIETYEVLKLSNNNNSKDLKELNLSAREVDQIIDISLISNFENLESLFIWGGKITDISPIGNLKKLKKLEIQRIGVKDITAIGNLVNLESLEIYSVEITDISPIGNLKNLKKLVINDIGVKDITAISKLINLETLEIYSDKITDIPPIGNFGNLKKLKKFIVNGKRVNDIKAIGNLVNLEIFAVETNMPPVRYISDNIEIKSPEYIGKTNLPEGYYEIKFKSNLNGREGFYLSTKLFFDTTKMEVIHFYTPEPMHWGVFRPPFSNSEMPISGHDLQIHVYNVKTHEYYYLPEDNYHVLITDSDRIHLTDRLDTPEYTIAIQSHYRMSYIGKDHKPIEGEWGTNGTDAIKPLLLAEFHNTIFDNPFFIETFDNIISSLNIITKYKLYFSGYREGLYEEYGEEYYGENGKYGIKYFF